MLTGDDDVKDRWLGYFDDLLNAENERDDLEGILPVQGPIDEIYLEEVITHLGKTKHVDHLSINRKETPWNVTTSEVLHF